MEEDELLIEMKQYNPHNNTFDELSVKKEIASNQEFQDTSMKIEKTESICRACLKEGDIPIFGSKSSEDVSNAFSMLAGVSISSDDPYTKFLCNPCNMHLGSAILFRKTAQHSDLLLKSTVIVDNSQDDVQSDNNYFEIKVEKNELRITHSLSCKNQLQKTVKAKRKLNKRKERFGNNKKNKHVNSLQNLITVAANLTSEKKNISKKECLKHKKKDMPYCRTCNKSFQSIDALIVHNQIEKHEINKKECPICHKMYATLYIKTHMKVHGTTTNICDVCGKSFHLREAFYQHKATHTNKLPHKCTLCPYKTRSSESLNRHMRTHTGEKPYQCTECSSAFTTKSNLLAHEKRHHREKEFSCGVCNKEFSFKRDLEIHHKATHLGIMEHECDICGKEFGSRSQMMKHTRKVHKRAKLAYGRQPLYLQIESMKQQEGSIPEET